MDLHFLTTYLNVITVVDSRATWTTFQPNSKNEVKRSKNVKKNTLKNFLISFQKILPYILENGIF